MKAKWTGTGVALVTPFDNKYHVDFQGLQKLLHYVMDSQVDYLVVHGTTGEAATTTVDEQKAILSFIHTQNTSKLPIICGISGNHTSAVLKTIASIDLEGIDAVLVTCPYYNKPSQEGIYQHYQAVADACSVPILLYNIPARTGTNIAAATTLRLSTHPNILGIKEASGDLLQCMDIVKGKHDDFLVIAGDDMLTLPMIAIGAIGVISAIANGLPKKMRQIVDLALQCNMPAARTCTLELLPVDKLVRQVGNPVGTKAMLAALGICQSHVRLPLVQAPQAFAKVMHTAILQLQHNTL